jgi:hypothetical protein
MHSFSLRCSNPVDDTIWIQLDLATIVEADSESGTEGSEGARRRDELRNESQRQEAIYM